MKAAHDPDALQYTPPGRKRHGPGGICVSAWLRRRRRRASFHDLVESYGELSLLQSDREFQEKPSGPASKGEDSSYSSCLG
ncbi:hypothetical protein NSU_0018 [Novosphingobium pentaromativorans US6-1]|uniref:Uncharacterized protein n=1 Tax=Novosphingobium pentaromativorans US6-1 TaxID=1088721 RepID=G6E6P6_9SPHN|nr:hypothetical protein NSU_0018 [Novosphingobium pentaromativorans US6-1]